MIPRTLVDLLTDQIEFANVMVLNKVGAAAPGRLEQARKIIRALDPDAKVIETDDSRIHPVWVFVTSLFDFNRTHEHPLWAKELYGFAHHVPETEEYGVSSFKYRARRPLDPVRIHAVLKGEPKGVIRAQGHFWIATVPYQVRSHCRLRRPSLLKLVRPKGLKALSTAPGAGIWKRFSAVPRSSS